MLSLDADMIRFDNPEKFIKTFIDSKKDIIVPRIQRLDMQDYDKILGVVKEQNQQKNNWRKWIIINGINGIMFLVM